MQSIPQFTARKIQSAKRMKPRHFSTTPACHGFMTRLPLFDSTRSTCESEDSQCVKMRSEIIRQTLVFRTYRFMLQAIQVVRLSATFAVRDV